MHEGTAVHGVFLRWRAVNLHWDVRSYDKAADLEESSAGGPAAAPLVPRTLWLPLGPLGGGHLQTSELQGPHSHSPWSCPPCCWPYLCPCGAGPGGGEAPGGLGRWWCGSRRCDVTGLIWSQLRPLGREAGL